MTSFRKVNSYIKTNLEEIACKCRNYINKIPLYFELLKQTPEQKDSDIEVMQRFLDAQKEHNELKIRLKVANSNLRNCKVQVQKLAAQRKQEFSILPEFTRDICEDLGLQSHTVIVETSALKPRLRVTAEGNTPILRFIKKRTDGVRIYRRINHQGHFVFLDVCTTGKYIDRTPNADLNTKEIREYYATYILKGELVGKDSEICDVIVKDS
ncbi:MAG: hypothetical protein ACEPOZ_16335 [Marinifilaceae bacterium]